MNVVDDYLAAARALLGTGHSPTPAAPAPNAPAPGTPSTWSGGAAENADRRTATLDTHRGQLHTVNTHTHRLIIAAAEIPTSGHRTLNAIQSGWESDKAALAPWANTAAGKAALLRAGQHRIAETRFLIGDVAARYGAAAAAIRTTQLGLPTAPAPDDDIDPATGVPRRRDPHAPRPADEPKTPPGPHRPTPATTPAPTPAPTSAPRPFTAPPAAMPSSPLTSLATPLTSSLPATAAVPSLASAAPAALSPMLQPLTQLSSPSQTVLASSLSPTAGEQSSARDDPRSNIREKIVAEARRALGLPYVWGGGGARGPSGGGFDCSGLTQFAVAQATGGQVILPRTTYGQIYCGRAVDLAHARPGDLVFSNFSYRGPEHVQIFAGRTDAGVPMVIEAQQRGVPVKFSELSGPAVFRRVI